MKPLYILILLSTLSLPLLPQELDYSDLLAIYNFRTNLEWVDSFLANKNFSFQEYKDNSYVFSLNRNSKNMAAAFCMVNKDFIGLQSHDRQTFTYFKDIANSRKMKLTDSGATDDGAMFFDYKSSSAFLKLVQIMNTAGNGSTSYMIFFRLL